MKNKDKTNREKHDRNSATCLVSVKTCLCGNMSNNDVDDNEDSDSEM